LIFASKTWCLVTIANLEGCPLYKLHLVHVRGNPLTKTVLFVVAFQLESTDGVTVRVYATTTAPLIAKLPSDSGECVCCGLCDNVVY